MKKFVCLFLVMGAVLVLAACGGGSNPIRDRGTVLDYRSILDTELNLMFSLGDYRGDVEAVLGRPFSEYEVRDGARQSVVYDNGLLISYEDNHAVMFSAANIFYYPNNPENEEVRFEILDVPIGVTEEEIAEIFEMRRTTHLTTYERIFNIDFTPFDDVSGPRVFHSIRWSSEDIIGYDITVWEFWP